MEKSSLVKDISLGEDMVRLILDGDTPSVQFRDLPFTQLWLLCNQCPCLCDPAYFKEFAEIANFLWKGSAFQYIDNIEGYQSFYLSQIELEKMHPTDVFPFRLTDYKIFDISVMHEPRLIENHLHFFVFQTETRIPYRVVSPYPYTSLSTLVHYQILPLKG